VQAGRVIDLSADFRLRSAGFTRSSTATTTPTGVVEEVRLRAAGDSPEGDQERFTRGSPGCYPTSVLLPLFPLLRSGLIKSTGIIADSLSGVERRGSQTRTGLPLRRMQRKRPAYGDAEAPASVGD